MHLSTFLSFKNMANRMLIIGFYPSSSTERRRALACASRQTLSVITCAAIIALNYNYTTHNRVHFKYSLLILIRDENRFRLVS